MFSALERMSRNRSVILTQSSHEEWLKIALNKTLANVRFGALADVTIFIEKASICSKYYPAREP